MNSLVAVLMLSLTAEPPVGQSTEKLVGGLIQIITARDTDLWMKKEALRALGKLGSNAKSAVDQLVRQFGRIPRGEETALQEAIIDTLGNIGPAARPAVPLLTRLAGQDLDIDRAVARAIDQIMALPEHVEIHELVVELRSQDASRRLRAAKALGAMGRKAETAINELLPLARDPDTDVRRLSIAALRAIQPETTPTAAQIEAYVLDLRDADESVRLVAARGLSRLGPAAVSAVPALQKLQEDKSADVRQAAVDAIAKISGQ